MKITTFMTILKMKAAYISISNRKNMAVAVLFVEK